MASPGGELIPGLGPVGRPGFVVLLAAVLLLAGLGSTDVWAPDEPRYAQVAEEVRALEGGLGDAVLLQLNGAPYSQKPPLYYWLAAIFGSFGDRVNEVAARLPSALAGIGVVAAGFALGGRMFGPGVGWWTAIVLLSVYRFDHLARRAQLDVLLTLFETLALWAFWRFDRDRASSTRHLVVLHGAVGMAVLTKGPVGLLPLAIAAAFLAWEGRAAETRRILPWWGWLLSLGPGLVWVSGALWLAPAGFFGEAVVDNVFGRFFSGTSHARPFYYFLYQLPADFLPWTLVLPFACGAWWRSLRRPAEAGAPGNPHRFLATWILLPLLFFSLSAGKRGLYLLPVFPALAIVCGQFVHQRLRDRTSLPRGLGIALGGLAALGATLGVVLWGVAAGGIALPNTSVRIPAALGMFIMGASALGAAVPKLARALGRDIGPEGKAATAVVAWIAVLFAVFTLLYPALDAEKSPRPVADAARSLAGPSRAIGVFDYRSLVGAMVYYGGTPVIELPDEAAARRFLEAGHRVVVARARHESRLRRLGDVSVADRHRSGSRELLVVEIAASHDAPRR